ncbi:alginate O-acetyltransferase AlgX-related protein [Actinophytocola glycyrrhizae]|uniref:AlgX/AlgJ SGNH hydrolase-like domain-containing protein n=1 Tax=Actinophytocola glycyrrhizae TaxID=2044873 RepID=A0ABV9S2S9_9PSEU
MTTELPPVHEAWLPREHSLHRPRHGKRQLTALISALVFFATPALMWVFGMRPSEIENHELASFPSAGDGWGLFTGLEPWATDNLVFREEAISAADWVSRTIFGEPPPFDQGGATPTGPLPGTPGEQSGKPEPDEDAPVAGPPAGTEQAGFRNVVEGTDGWLYYGSDALSKCHPTKPLAETIAQLAKLRDVVERSGRTFVLVLVPDKTTMVPEYLPDSYPGKECAAPVTPQVWEQAIEVAGGLDMRPRLAAAAERHDRPMYYPLDTHWTSEGALEMVKAVAQEVKPGVAEKWRIQKKDEELVTADLPRLVGRDGDNKVVNYRLKPDGRYDRARDATIDLIEQKHYDAERLQGMVYAPTAVLGDSFLVNASSYLPAAFADLTMQYYRSAQNRPDEVIDTFTDAEIVVFEVVERNIAAGVIDLLDQRFLDQLDEELRKHPVG